MQCIDKTLEKYRKEQRSNSQEFLFGEEFCSQLKSKVELYMTLSQIVSLLKRFHLYGEQSGDSSQATLGQASNSFSKGLHQKSWVLAGSIVSKQAPTPKSPSPAVQFTKPLHPQLFGEVQGETLDKLCLPHIAFMALHLDMTLVTQKADRPVGGRTSQTDTS